ncbi:MAG: DUF5615 family PIN-like protein [Cyclobacteriaceae bacterium]|nr:DUF5615 family PIN-like protein [Cyclobacteriaceae bacterium HetDA_MAG_MS6]
MPLKFVIDENLPVSLPEVFRSRGWTCYHINELKQNPKSKISDQQIRHFSLFKDYVVVTRDDDFVRSYVNRKVPERVIFVFGTFTKENLLHHFEANLDQAIDLVRKFDFVELGVKGIRTPFEA